MGALASNRKRGDDYYKLAVSALPPVDPSDGHISKRPRLSPQMKQNTVEFGWPKSSSSIASRISSYPDVKAPFPRDVQGPVRNLKFPLLPFSKRSDSSAGSVENSANVKGNLFARYTKTRDIALGSLRYFREEDEAFTRKEMGKEVIGIDEGDDGKQDDIPDGSSIQEMDIALRKDGLKTVDISREAKVEMLERESRSLDSSVVTEVSNEAAKVDGVMDLMLLEKEPGNLGLPAYKRLLDSVKEREGKLNGLEFEIELVKKHIQGYRSLWSQEKRERVKKDLAEECFKPLTEEEGCEVDQAFSSSKRRKVLVSHENSNIDITGEKLQCLMPGAWLNDEVINVYLELVKERERRAPEKFLKCHFFNTFFYKKLINGRGGYNYQSVRRWTFQRKLGYCLLECDKTFVPIHQQNHWCLAVINKKEEKFQYLDSLGGCDSQVLDVLARYYVDEVKDKSGKDINISSWEKEFVKNLPKQENRHDCGVFMIKYADFYSRNIGLCFSQDHMPYFRRRTAKEILKLIAE